MSLSLVRLAGESDTMGDCSVLLVMVYHVPDLEHDMLVLSFRIGKAGSQ